MSGKYTSGLLFIILSHDKVIILLRQIEFFSVNETDLVTNKCSIVANFIEHTGRMKQ